MAQNVQKGNPMGALLQNDPRMKDVYSFINQNGGDPKAAFYALAKQKGYDPQEVLNQVSQMLK